LFGEETEVLEGIKSRGGFGAWVPSARVKHFVPDSRVTRSYLRRYFFGMGRSQVRMGKVPIAKTVLGAPRPLIRQLTVQIGKYFAARIRGGTSWVEPYTRACEIFGVLVESRAKRPS
ncbi:MAG: hypothetical protein ACKN9V_07955, partial [Pseudomonadota bacterium]